MFNRNPDPELRLTNAIHDLGNELRDHVDKVGEELSERIDLVQASADNTQNRVAALEQQKANQKKLFQWLRNGFYSVLFGTTMALLSNDHFTAMLTHYKQEQNQPADYRHGNLSDPVYGRVVE